MPTSTCYLSVFIVAAGLWFATSAPAEAPDRPFPVFTDVTADAGIEAKHSFGDFDLSNIVEGTGSGVVVFDYNNDQLPDIYLPNGCWSEEINDNRGRSLRGKLHNHLYRNEGDGTFTDVTEKAGVGDEGFGVGASAADYDGDGDLDLYLLNYGPNVFYRNNGDGTFTDVTEIAGLGDARWSLSAPWLDYDADGDLDVYVVNYLEYDKGKFRSYYAAAGYPGPLSYGGQQDILYRNNGDGTFTDVSAEAGVVNPDGRGMSATAADLDNSGRLDILVANDAMENFYYNNQGDGTFVDEALMTGLAFGEAGQGVSSMGPTTGDVDRDGRIDVYIPDMGYGCLQLNRGDFFEDWTNQSRLAVTCGQYTGWGGVLADFDNDGYLDIFVANGNAHHEFPEEDVLMHNQGNGTFEDIAAKSGSYFREKYVGRGAASADFDNDGDLDLIVVNLNDRPRLLRNDGGNAGNWLKIDARRPDGKREAIGARIIVETGSLRQMQDLVPYRGYLSQSDWRTHFGLKNAPEAEKVTIRWPDGSETVLEDVPANQILTVVQGRDNGSTE